MTNFLLKIFGIKVEEAAGVSGVELHFRNSGALGWILLLGLGCATLAWWTYSIGGHASLGARRKWTLVALRTALFVLILLIFLQPVLAFQIEGKIRALVIGLFDESGSMKIQDPRLEEADLKRAAIGAGALDSKKGLEQKLDAARTGDLKNIARDHLVKEVLKNEDLGLLKALRQNYDFSAFGFGKDVRPLSATGGAPTGEENPPAKAASWVEQIQSDSPFTAIGDALRTIIKDKRGQPLAGIFLVTDGANNSGSQALAAANFAAEEKVPLYVYGVGIASPRDVIVSNLFTQETAFVKDELPVTVRVRGQGLVGQEAQLVLKLGGEIVATKAVTFSGDAEQVVSLKFAPKAKGDFPLEASIEPRADEAVKDNNRVSQQIKVIDDKIKVLMIEQAPRWEYQYIRMELLRDRRIDLKTLLFQADAKVAEEENSPYLKEFPRTKEELFKLDLVILGDVERDSLPADALENLDAFVSKFGGALLVIAGHEQMPAAYRGTALEKMLPVELEPAAAVPARASRPEPAKKKIALELTSLGRAEPMLKLTGGEKENAETWEKLPPIYWAYKVERAKPAAKVLLVDADPAKATRFGKMPVMAQQQFGVGQVLYLGTDNLWRWRKNKGEEEYARLWSQIVQRMALLHLLGSKRTQLSVDKEKYTTGERVHVFARLYGADFEPLKTAAVKGSYAVRAPGSAPGAEPAARTSVELRAVPEQPGMFRGDFVALTAGSYRFAVETDAAAAVEFAASKPQFEIGETAMNEALLREMAKASGGRFFREEDLHELPAAIAKQAEKIHDALEAEIWSSPLYYMLMLCVATAEWILRKRFQLK